MNKVVEASLQKQLRGSAQYTWDGWNDAADYLVSNKVDLDEALRSVSIGSSAIHETGHFYFAQTGHSHFAPTLIWNRVNAK